MTGPKKETNENLMVCTKRNVLSEVAKTYDPLGLLSPVTLLGKLFIQKLWNKKLKWDEKMSDVLQQEWKMLLRELEKITKISLPRFITFLNTENTVHSLHCFTDASKDAYAAAVYLETEQNGNKKVALVFAKTRVKPKGNVTIPRIELLAMTIGKRAILHVEKELKLPIKEKYIWTDSQCTLK